jgi:hypothetical protein
MLSAFGIPTVPVTRKSRSLRSDLSSLHSTPSIPNNIADETNPFLASNYRSKYATLGTQSVSRKPHKAAYLQLATLVKGLYTLLSPIVGKGTHQPQRYICKTCAVCKPRPQYFLHLNLLTLLRTASGVAGEYVRKMRGLCRYYGVAHVEALRMTR